ncbi:hypothetical protein [Kitasatospora sp. McL0602]|uniref:hypothetical protein n=1 Tax=Kitasatospora sp. McL0602 TaxID=3439530 RepID=UPI003F8A0E93
MNASARTARQILRDRTRTQRAAARITRRGTGTLTTHAVAQGLTTRDARSVAGSLRKAAAKLAITGSAVRVHAGRQMRNARHYTPAQVAQLAATYRPRKAEYKTVAAKLALAA